MTIVTRLKNWHDTLPIWLIFVVGTVNIASAVQPALTDRLTLLMKFLPPEVPAYSRLFVLVSGLIFYVLAYHLNHGSRLAWNLTVSFLALSSIGHLLKGIDYEEITLSLLTIFALWRTRSHYRQLSPLPSLRRAFFILFYSFLALVTYGTIGLSLLDERHFGTEFTLGQAIHNSFLLYFVFGVASLTPKTLFARLFLFSTGLISAGFYLYIFGILFSPFFLHFSESWGSRIRARRLVEEFGNDALDTLKTASDKHIFFTNTDDAFVGFGVARNIMVAFGDPVALSPKSATNCLRTFYESAQTGGWRLAFFQISGRYRGVYEVLGLKIIEIGQDAIVDLSSFSTEGPHMKNLRTACNQLERLGFSVEFTAAPFSRKLWREAASINDEWLTIPGRRERAFSQGIFGMQFDNNVLSIVRDSSGRAIAFLSLLIYPRTKTIAIDLIRRRIDIPNGTMDFLFTELFEHYRTQGYRECNLGMAPLAGAKDVTGDHWLGTLLAISYERLGWVFNFRGLKKFKAKFNPRWEPRYLAYQSDTDIFTLGLALLELTGATNKTSKKVRIGLNG